MTIYFVEMEGQNKIKIGYTAKEAKRRVKELQTGQPNKLILIGTIPGEKDGEAGLHKEFSDIRGNGEWFEKTKELCAIISFLIGNQHPWYFCRSRRNFSEMWERWFCIPSSADRSAHDDCAFEPLDVSKVTRGLSRRLNQHRRKFGKDQEWEAKFRKNMIAEIKRKKIHPYVEAWAA